MSITINKTFGNINPHTDIQKIGCGTINVFEMGERIKIRKMYKKGRLFHAEGILY